jgi:hypothetical protein
VVSRPRADLGRLGFRQHFRRRAVQTRIQSLELDERGGISFDQPLDFPA